MKRVQIQYKADRSSVEERKSRHDNGEKHVTWSPVEETVQEIVDSYCNIPVDDIWYSREDLREIRIHNEMVVSLLCSLETSNNRSSCLLETTPEMDTLRGLESWTDQGAWERFEHHRDCLNRVLDEQDRQRGIDKMEYQYTPYPLVKRINHLHLPFDHERLAALCRDATAKARRIATKRGQKDQLVLKNEPEHIVVVPLPKWQEGPATAAKDSDTVQTITSTEGAVSVNSEGNDSTNHAPAPPVPTEVRYGPPPPPISTTTTLMLEQRQRERFAAYLVNRQKRMEAREKAELEREQRGLERRASIRMEADANIEQLKRILRLSDELVALIAASDIV